jgi:O-antigen ligase
VTEAWSARLGTWLPLATVALLPFGRSAELPLLLAALAGIALALRGAIELRAAALQLALMLFAGYWLPELCSAPDSLAPRKSWTEVAADLRFLPLLCLAVPALQDERAQRAAQIGFALLLTLWCADALLQAATGWSLGGAARGDRLSGIFGDDNLKLGGVIATLAPFGLVLAWQRHGLRAALLAFLPVLAVVLLAGARAAWLSLALVVALLLWHRLGLRRGSLALAATALLALAAGTIAYAGSARFAERIDRTASALGGNAEELDHALAYRVPIWRAAVAMGAAHPLNGVGVRAFRHAYPDFAAPDDRWLDPRYGTGALHAHQLLLELWSETGIIGLMCWALAAGIALRAWRRATPAARERAIAPGLALAAMLFPLNTHYAVYSSFWSLLLFALLALWLGALHPRRESDRA